MTRWRQYQSTILIYAILLLVLSGMVVPLVWTLLTSFKYNVDVTLGVDSAALDNGQLHRRVQRLLLPPLLRQFAVHRHRRHRGPSRHQRTGGVRLCPLAVPGPRRALSRLSIDDDDPGRRADDPAIRADEEDPRMAERGVSNGFF